MKEDENMTHACMGCGSPIAECRCNDIEPEACADPAMVLTPEEARALAMSRPLGAYRIGLIEGAAVAFGIIALGEWARRCGKREGTGEVYHVAYWRSCTVREEP